MENQSHISPASPDDGADQGAERDCGEALCGNQVSGPQTSGSHWTSRPGAELEEETHYKIRGGFLNKMSSLAITNFNYAKDDNEQPFSYARAFWNGYASAVASLQDFVRHNPVDPTVQ